MSHEGAPSGPGDVTQLLGSGSIASLTANTDFAETEVDARQTNLTRFPLFFPEKRTFFLEGSDIFQFGLGTGRDVLPFFSRRIGLVAGIAKRPGEGGHRRHGQGVVEHPVPVRPGRLSGHQGSACRDAHRALGVGVGEADTAPGKLVQSGREYAGIAGHSQALGGPVVGADQEDVGAGGNHGFSPGRRSRRNWPEQGPAHAP